MDNIWVKYVDRSYAQTKAAILTRMQSEVPEITDHTEGNFFVRLISIWSGLAEMLGYYNDNVARESHLSSARLLRSAVKIAESRDYRIKSAIPATVQLAFSLANVTSADIVIPEGTTADTADGTRFVTTRQLIIPIGNKVGYVDATQLSGSNTIALGNSSALVNQVFVIGATGIADNSCVITVNGITWEGKDTLGFSDGAATVFVQTMNEDGDTIIRFGDGVNGAIPANGAAISVTYSTTLGLDGNVGAGAVIEHSALNALTVTNITRASNGANREDLTSLKKRIPLAIRTVNRAVTRQDHIDIAELQGGVASAGVDFNCDQGVTVYVVPYGGGLATDVFVASIEEAFATKKIVGLPIRVLPAGEVRLRFVVEVNAIPGYSMVAVREDVVSAINSFVSVDNQSIGNTVYLGDIYEIVENVPGVANSTVTLMRSVPYARRLNTTNVDLSWSVSIKAASQATKKWEVRFVSETTYQLIGGGSFIGSFDIGEQVDLREVVFTIFPNNYVSGNSWEFYTYNSYGTLVLEEQSLPISLASDVTVNVTGGV